MSANDVKIVSGVAQGGTPNVKGTEALVDPTWGAQRTSLRPYDYKFAGSGSQGGHYRLSAMTGLTTVIAAAGAIFSMRWSESTKLFVLTRVQVGAILTTAFGTAQAVDADIVACRGFTAPDTGGTVIALTNNNNKTDQGMKASAVSDMRIATTAALGAGTKTQDGNAFGHVAVPNTNAIGTGSAPLDIYANAMTGQHPMVFAQNEGFNIRVATTQGATGVVKYYIVVEWAETPGI